MRKDKRRQSKLFRILGYIVAIVVNVIMLIFVNNILEFDWDFIKSSFSECLPWIVFSIWVTIIINIIYIFFDKKWFKNLLEAISLIISLIVAWKVYTVFPFDFSILGSFDFNFWARIAMICAMIGMIVGLIANIVKFFINLATFR